MNSRYMTSALLLTAGLAVATDRTVNHQDLTNTFFPDSKTHAIQAITQETIQEFKRALTEEIKKEVVMQILAETKRESSNYEQRQAKVPITRPISREIQNRIAPTLAAISKTGNNGSTAPLVALAKQFIKAHESSTTNAVVATPQVPESQEVLLTDLLTVVTNKSNPLKALSIDQVRRIFAGEFTNWAQVGGPDLPVKVVVYRDSMAGMENLMGVSVSSHSVQLGYRTLIIPTVDRVRGAVGFLPADTLEQFQFVIGHDALSKIAIKSDKESPGVMPSAISLRDGSYPLVGSAYFANAVPMERAQALPRGTWNVTSHSH